MPRLGCSSLLDPVLPRIDKSTDRKVATKKLHEKSSEFSSGNRPSDFPDGSLSYLQVSPKPYGPSYRLKPRRQNADIFMTLIHDADALS
jgi:hypothetical protein